VRKLKILLPAFILIGFVAVMPVVSCKKTYTTVVQDSVYHSGWMTINMKATNAGDTAYIQDITVKALTASVLRSGAVLSYVGSPSNGDTAVYPASDVALYQVFDVNLIELQSFGYKNDYSTSNSGLYYRYVIVPANVLTTTLKGYSQDQLKKMSFTEVQSLLGPSAGGASTGQGNSLH
jgi:hypothetical protein